PISTSSWCQPECAVLVLHIPTERVSDVSGYLTSLRVFECSPCPLTVSIHRQVESCILSTQIA
uniref:Uncharacterized protein n=1 Tax=Anopheles arabiensis TaxID=7173 RepID=A0A182HMM0_ANOAR